MARHTWTYRLIPPLILAVIVSCLWYAIKYRPTDVATTPTNQASASNSTVPNSNMTLQDATAAPAVSPTVKKLGTHLEFSVKDVPYKQVSKVEFYVEKHMVGAAFSQPYSVTVSENSLTAGTHTVVAKIYTTTTTANSSPASFVAKPATPPAPAADSENRASSGTAPNGTNAPVSLPTPTNLAGTAATDGTAATLTWSGVDGATSYTVWRDGTQVATVTGTGYSDTGLKPGQTYDYKVIAVNANASSSPSALLPVTMPDPHVLGDDTDEPAIAPNNPPQPNTTPQAPANTQTNSNPAN